jgi:prevent-host-death family protein
LEDDLSDKMSDMKIVTLRALRRHAELIDSAAEGEEILVTRFGKPYVRIVSAVQAKSFLGAGKHLKVKHAVTPDRVPSREWKDLG